MKHLFLRHLFLLCLLIPCLLLMLVACGEPVPSSPTPKDTSTTPSFILELQTLLGLVNEARATPRQCGTQSFAATTPLQANTKLTLAAQKHSEDMTLTGKLEHTTQAGAKHYAPGTTFDARMKQEAYTFKTAGENIAYNYATPELVMKAWLASPGHCKNIMNSAFTEIGLGKASVYWTQDFAAPQ
jgi:uncharacterized protein YkwD